jgi:hypothetical protein
VTLAPQGLLGQLVLQALRALLGLLAHKDKLGNKGLKDRPAHKA